MPCPKTGATQCHTQLGLPDQDHAIKGLVVCNETRSSTFGPAKRSAPIYVVINCPLRYESYVMF